MILLLQLCFISIAGKIPNTSLSSIPKIKVTADYCTFPGEKVRITATSDIPVTNWSWSFGLVGTNTDTTSYIDVDNAGIFYVTAISAADGSSGSAFMEVAQELVANGDFEAGNTGFTSDYVPVANTLQQGLQPEGTYSVSNSPNFMHNYFWGRDHSVPGVTGNYMLVNGTKDKVVWKQTVSVLPGNTYYFSAYAVSLNDVAPFANLKFQVNGMQVGSPTGTLPSKTPDNNSGTWVRFYGNWNSQLATTAVIEIIDLENAASGNDFGLDDISFGTLSTFLNMTSAPGTDNQASVCVKSPIVDISYEIGSDGNEPVLTNIPEGLTKTWDGRTVLLSGTPSSSGIYNYSISGTGCNTKTFSGIITVDAASKSGTLPVITSTCFDMGGTLTLTGKTGEVTKWITSGDGGATWNDIANTTTAFNFSNARNTALYKVIVKNKSCKADTSAIAKVGIRNLWTGEESIDWDTGKNWSDEALPSPDYCDDIIIPVVSSGLYPVLSAKITFIKNLKILNGASLSLAGHMLQISGSINNYGTINADDGTIELNGTNGDQIIAGSFFKNHTLKNLIISNNVTVSDTINDTLNILGTLAFGNASAKLNTGDNITLKSTASGTAAVGMAGEGNSITGKVIVERYFNMGNDPGQHGKAWQFLATPTQGQTVWQSWMENGNKSSTGYGTQITGAGTGFDLYTATPALKYYNSATDAWVGITNTTNPVYYPNGYMLFVRGDRSVAFPNMNNTTLRTKGTLILGETLPITVQADHFESVGNPYPSPIDFTKINKTNGIDDKFYVWDPYISGYYNVGGYQTLSSVNNWRPVPGGSPLYPTNVSCSTIQSGYAFFVHATTVSDSIPQNDSVSFSENSKVSQNDFSIAARKGSGNLASIARYQSRTSLMDKKQFFTVSLFTGPGKSDIIADGNVVVFGNNFSNDFDGDDALKITTAGENFDLKRNEKTLSIEARSPVISSDTIYYNMSHLAQRTYQLRFAPENMESNGMEAFLVDKFLNTTTPVSLTGSTFINITISSNAASAAADRFKVIFKAMAPLPLTFTSIKATKKNADILVEWKIENETNMKQYEVERSSDGIHFTKAATVVAANRKKVNYSWLDQNASVGYNYYRVSSIDINGQTSFTQIVKVLATKTVPGITMYPNPISSGMINLHFTNQHKGIYHASVISSSGQVILSKTIAHKDGSGTETLALGTALSHGIYQVEVILPAGDVKVFSIIY